MKISKLSQICLQEFVAIKNTWIHGVEEQLLVGVMLTNLFLYCPILPHQPPPLTQLVPQNKAGSCRAMEEKLGDLKDSEPDEGLPARVVKKRIDLVRTNSLESVRVSARQAERKAKASRDNSEDGRSEERLGKVKKLRKDETDAKTKKSMTEPLRLKEDQLQKVKDILTKVDVIEEDFSTPKYERQESNSDLFDELVMDFVDEDLDQEPDEMAEDDSDDLVEEDRMVEDIAGEVAGELLEEKEAEDSEPEAEPEFEDVEPPAEESDEDYDEQATTSTRKTSTRISSGKDKIWKYGKLWEFIRDLLKIPRYNPSVIRYRKLFCQQQIDCFDFKGGS